MSVVAEKKIKIVAKDEWFRNTKWNKEIEDFFELKLKRARGSHSKAQYLRIQARYLLHRHSTYRFVPQNRKPPKSSKTKNQQMKKIKLPSLLIIISIISLNLQNCSAPNSQEESEVEITNPKEEETTKETKTSYNSIDTEKKENASGDSNIQFIKDKYAIITSASNYKVDSTTVECTHGTTRIERRSTEKGELRYLLEEACGDHGCLTTHHYFWDNNLIFMYRQNYYYAGNSEYLKEHRTYFKNNKMFRCLEKDISTTKGYEVLKKVAKKTSNKTVDCTPDKRTKNIQQLIELDLNKAKELLCD